MAYLYEIQTRECRDPGGYSEFHDVSRQIYVEAPDLKNLNDVQTNTKMIRCFSCGALVPDIEGPVHKYIDSAPGCWKLYGDILAKEYNPDFYSPDIHRITVDTYAVQHPGKPERRAIQSVNTHLISLYCLYEKKLSGEQATQIIRSTVENNNLTEKFIWLQPPAFGKTRNVTDVLKATNRTEHEKFVREWGNSVWQAWKEKHFETTESFAITLIKGLTPDEHGNARKSV